MMNTHNKMVCRMVEEIMIMNFPKLADPNFRKNLPADKKKQLVSLMCKMAVEMGAEPTQPLNI